MQIVNGINKKCHSFRLTPSCTGARMKSSSLGAPELTTDGREFRAGQDFPDGMVGDVIGCVAWLQENWNQLGKFGTSGWFL